MGKPTNYVKETQKLLHQALFRHFSRYKPQQLHFKGLDANDFKTQIIQLFHCDPRMHFLFLTFIVHLIRVEPAFKNILNPHCSFNNRKKQNHAHHISFCPFSIQIHGNQLSNKVVNFRQKLIRGRWMHGYFWHSEKRVIKHICFAVFNSFCDVHFFITTSLIAGWCTKTPQSPGKSVELRERKSACFLSAQPKRQTSPYFLASTSP